MKDHVSSRSYRNHLQTETNGYKSTLILDNLLTVVDGLFVPEAFKVLEQEPPLAVEC